jgi:hypothetical protein
MTLFHVRKEEWKLLERQQNIYDNLASLISSISYGQAVEYDFENEVCPFETKFTV